MYTCKFCPKVCQDPRGYRRHLNMSHADVFKTLLELERHFIEFIYKIDPDIITQEYNSGIGCTEIDKLHNFSQAKRWLLLNNVTLRTPSEAKKTKSYIDRYKNTCQTRYGVDNVSKVTAVKLKKKRTSFEHYNYENNFCNDKIKKLAQKKSRETADANGQEIREKYKKTCREKYGVDNVSQDKDIAKRISKTKKQNFKNMSKAERRKTTEICRKALKNSTYAGRSNLELHIEEILSKTNIKFKANKYIGGWNYDFVLNGRIVIEIQGDYFHANPIKYKATDWFPQFRKTAQHIWDKDLKKKRRAERYGYSVYTLWESDLSKLTDGQIFELIINIKEKDKECRSKKLKSLL